MQAHREHQQREAGIVQRGHERIVRIDQIEQLGSDDDSGGDLSNDDGYRKTLPGREQRPEEARCDDHGKYTHGGNGTGQHRERTGDSDTSVSAEQAGVS
ncbi:unannotated protein [freshwater metagenome]|uniref:Unannotated protein n=1 Tax=freshwater metagenome TaxID=449393 RepID=A0A6J6IPJ5_9ZZZZ